MGLANHKHLEFNEGSGCICESEADTITNALKQEWGGFNDVLRKAFHNETILSSRRADFDYTKIEVPKLSLSITGTPDQVEGILNSTQNGLASRFMFYSFYTPPKWKKTFTKNISHSKQNQFMKFTQDLCNKFSSQSSIQFNLTESQGETLDNIFSETLDEKYQLHSGDSSSLVLRLGEITYKIAMVLSAVRTDEPIMECEDRDFDTAMELTKVYLAHGLNVFQKINNRENKLPLNEERWMNKLPKEFTSGEAIKIAKKLGIKERTVYKKLRDYVESNIITRARMGVYKKLK